MTLNVGSTAPDFELPNQYGQSVRLSSFVGVKPVALVFFPLAFTGICTGELCELRDNIKVFAQKGVELLAVSVDNKASLRVFSDTEGFDFSLLADFWPHGEVARSYDVFIEDRGYASRATFLIDTGGVIRAAFESAGGTPRRLAQYRKAVAVVT
ncbi:MAG: peroxiredoxin [Microbacteriaceae bacterium]